MSTYANILKTLNNSFYSGEEKKLSEISFDADMPKNPKLAVATIFDMRAAQMLSHLENINLAETTHLTSNIRSGQDAMTVKREALAYKDTIESQTKPLFTKTEEIFRRKEEIEERAKQYVRSLNQEIPFILNGTPLSSSDKINFLEQEQKKIMRDISNLGREVSANNQASRQVLQSIRSIIPEFKVAPSPVVAEEETRKPH